MTSRVVGVAVLAMASCIVECAVACTLTTSLDGLTGGSAPEAGQDAGEVSADANAVSDAADATILDAGADANRNDASDANPSDASDAADASFCGNLAAPSVFCADFDNGLMTGWDFDITNAGGTVAGDTSFSTSSPVSFAAATPMLATGTYGQAFLQATSISANGANVTVDFDVRPGIVNAGDTLVVLVLEIGPGTDQTRHGVSLIFGSDTTTLQEQIPRGDGGPIIYQGHTVNTGLALGVWSHVEIVLQIAATTTSSLSVNGSMLLPATAMTGTWPVGNLLLQLGDIYVAGPSAPWLMNFDNVVINAN